MRSAQQLHAQCGVPNQPQKQNKQKICLSRSARKCFVQAVHVRKTNAVIYKGKRRICWRKANAADMIGLLKMERWCRWSNSEASGLGNRWTVEVVDR
jgi:hypothetical protein